jgi:hypothetical protein
VVLSAGSRVLWDGISEQKGIGGTKHRTAERNSAREAASDKLQMPATTKPQMTDIDPPEGNASDSDAASAVQLLSMAKARPSIVHRENWRSKDCAWPNWAS